MAEAKKQKNGFIQFLLFIVMSLVAFGVQMAIVTWGDDLLLKIPGMEGKEIDAWIFGVQSLAVFIAFLIGNIVAKVISYILNRKKTFNAVNNLVFSMTVYTIMCVTLIIVETLIGAPLGKWLANTLPDGFWNILGTSQAQELASPDWSSTLAMILYSTADFIIVFLMEKFVIMNDNLFKKKGEAEEASEESEEEAAEVATEEEVVDAPEDEAPVAEEAKEEAPVEEAPVEEEKPAKKGKKDKEPEVEAAPIPEVAEEVKEEEPVAEEPAKEEAPVEEAKAEEPVAEETPVEEVKEEKPAKKAAAKKAPAKKAE